MSKLFHCRCAVAIRLAKSDKIIAFDESHIEDVRVSLSGFSTAFGALQSGYNATFPGGRYVTPDNTVSVTLNETVLDASWLALLDTGYSSVGYKGAIDFVRNKDGLESIYGLDEAQIQQAVTVKASQMVSDPVFSSDKGKALILEAQGKGDIFPNVGNPSEERISKVSDPTIFKDKLKEFINKAETTKDATTLSTAKKQIGLLLTAGRKNGIVPDTGNSTSPSSRPQQIAQASPQTQAPKESYGKIVFVMDHTLPTTQRGAPGAAGRERIVTDKIASYLKSEIERREPKIKVEIVSPDKFVDEANRKGNPALTFTDSANCGPLVSPNFNGYDNFVIDNYIKNSKNRATIIAIHLDAPKEEGGFGARVWNLENATSVSNKLTNVINGTYINKFRETNGQKKTSSIGRWKPCDKRTPRVFQGAPEGFALIEFGVFEKIGNFEQFKSDQKEAFNSLIDGLIQFKRSNGSSTNVPDAADPSTGESNSNVEQNTTRDFVKQPGILVTFWYDVNNYIAKVDYYFVLTSASVSFGDGPPKLNISGVSAYSIVFNTWRIQDSFAAGTPIDEVIRKIFSSDPTKTFGRSKVEFDKESPQEKLYAQEDLAGLTYAEFKSKLASKFDLQFLANPRIDKDNFGKIKVFREARAGQFSGSQVFWLGRGLFEKFEISVVANFTAFNAVAGGSSPYSDASTPSTALSPGSPFSSSDRVEFNKVPNQPSMILKFNGSNYTNQGLPPNGWEKAQTPGVGPGIQVVLKLPNGKRWPESGDFEIHNLGESRGEKAYGVSRSIALWNPSTKTFVIKSGKIHTAIDGGVTPGGELIAYFKGVVVDSTTNYGTVVIKYNRFVNVSINGRAAEYQLYQRTQHMTNLIDKNKTVDIGTKIGNQGTIGENGRSQYSNHCHEEFFINTPNGKTLYLDPFIVYNYSYSKDDAGNRTFDSAARVSTAATGSNNIPNTLQGGAPNAVNEQFLLRTEFAGIPRALQILPGQTFLNFVTDYNTYLTISNDNKANIDPGIPIINQLKDWMIYRCNFNWSGDLRINLDCYRPRFPSPIYAGQNWQSYRKKPAGKGPPLDDYYDYIRSIGDLSYITLDDNGQEANSLNTRLKAKGLLTDSGSTGGGVSPSITNGKCKYTGNRYINDKAFLDEVAAQLSNQGFNKIGIAGILGNISIESSFGKSLRGGEGTCINADRDERIENKTIPVKLPNGQNTTIEFGRCFGIVQWGGQRKIKAIEFIKGSGWTFAAHAAYVVKELRENERTCGCRNNCPERGKPIVDLLNNAKDAADAARIFRVCYERPSADDSKSRQDEASSIFQGLTCEE